jgi:hypothetical protein
MFGASALSSLWSRSKRLHFKAFANILELATLGCNSQSNLLIVKLATFWLSRE